VFSQYITEAVARQLELDLLGELAALLEEEHGPVDKALLTEAEAAWPRQIAAGGALVPDTEDSLKLAVGDQQAVRTLFRKDSERHAPAIPYD
jgi:hypothetical protein